MSGQPMPAALARYASREDGAAQLLIEWRCGGSSARLSSVTARSMLIPTKMDWYFSAKLALVQNYFDCYCEAVKKIRQRCAASSTGIAPRKRKLRR
jgi:hypothetical protein